MRYTMLRRSVFFTLVALFCLSLVAGPAQARMNTVNKVEKTYELSLTGTIQYLKDDYGLKMYWLVVSSKDKVLIGKPKQYSDPVFQSFIKDAEQGGWKVRLQGTIEEWSTGAKSYKPSEEMKYAVVDYANQHPDNNHSGNNDHSNNNNQNNQQEQNQKPYTLGDVSTPERAAMTFAIQRAKITLQQERLDALDGCLCQYKLQEEKDKILKIWSNSSPVREAYDFDFSGLKAVRSGTGDNWVRVLIEGKIIFYAGRSRHEMKIREKFYTYKSRRRKWVVCTHPDQMPKRQQGDILPDI